MISASKLKRPLHTEKGIMDAVPLLPGLPEPKVKIITPQHVDSESTSIDEKKKEEVKEKPTPSRVPPKPSTSFVEDFISFSPAPTRVRALTSVEPPRGNLPSFDDTPANDIQATEDFNPFREEPTTNPNPFYSS